MKRDLESELRNETDLFCLAPRKPHFDGATYEPRADHVRLTKQLAVVAAVMSDGKWHTLSAIASITGCNHASISARLRDLRKTKFGGYTVERRRAANVESGLFEYRVKK